MTEYRAMFSDYDYRRSSVEYEKFYRLVPAIYKKKKTNYKYKKKKHQQSRLDIGDYIIIIIVRARR